MAISKWQKMPLKCLCSRIGDGLHGTPTYDPQSGVYFINGNNLKDGKIEISANTNKVTNEDYARGFIELNSNSLLMSINGTLGSLAFYDGQKIMLGKSAAYMNFNSTINRFYYYYFQLNDVQQYFYNVATGSTIKNLSLKSLQDFNVPVPKKEEWEAIASVLSALDAKIELNNRINAELEAMAKTLYDYWFVQFEFPISAEQAAAMGQPQLKGKPYKSSGGKMVWNKELKREIPAGWEVGTLSDIIELNYGKPLKKEVRTGNGFPVVGSGGIVGYHDEPIVAGPGIVVGRKGTVGCITYLHENFFPIDTSYFVQPKVEIKFMYLLHLLNTLRLNSMNSDSAVPGLNRERALGVSIVLVPQKLIRHFESIVEPFFNKMLNSNQQNQQLASLRDWLLPMLMNGQVKVGQTGSKAYTADEGMDVAAEPGGEYGKIGN